MILIQTSSGSPITMNTTIKIDMKFKKGLRTVSFLLIENAHFPISTLAHLL